MPNNYGPSDSIIEGQRNRSRQLMAQSLLSTPGVGEGMMPSQNQGVEQASHELYRSGLQSYLSGDQQGAMANWQKALQINPSNMEARQGVVRLSQATAGATTASAPSEENYRAGLSQLLNGNDVGAAGAWQKAYAADPGNLDAKRGLQRILMKLTQQR